MRKLKLEADLLAVESFSTLPDQIRPAGTVQGRLLDPFYPQVPESLDLCDIGTTIGTTNFPTYSCQGESRCCAPTWSPTCEMVNTCKLTCEETCGVRLSCHNYCPL